MFASHDSQETLPILSQVGHLWRYREAVRTLVVRDLKVRYSNSALGIIWSLFSPLLMMLIFTLVFTLLMPSGIEKYPVFILAGLLPWNYFTGATVGCVLAVVANGHLISRVYFPREILPISMVLSNLVNFLVALLVLFPLVLAFRIPLGGWLVWLPAVVALQTVLSLGLGLGLSALNVRFRDTQQLVDVLILALFFMTPIVYSLDRIANPQLRWWVQVLNPMAALVASYRDLLYLGRAPDLGLLLLTAAEALVVLGLGYLFFQSQSPSFVEEL